MQTKSNFTWEDLAIILSVVIILILLLLFTGLLRGDDKIPLSMVKDTTIIERIRIAETKQESIIIKCKEYYSAMPLVPDSVEYIVKGERYVRK